MTTTLHHSGIRVQMATPKFKKGQSLIVTDCFGKPWPCAFEKRMSSQLAHVSINGSTFGVHPSQLSL
ncbi:hypothetical protein [Spirosoma foliorum]|uniref:Uncharacterized protein n=1 Tax=Spirosoma foliorum TaxID=2710596 RepID=A0A7G5H2N7_9BACT|nr:hypothetical protein [Spirosoma foliorum]QMW05379.1 hypothetical protein H3H32_11045 [Spirosoma foliorum]